MRKKWILPIVMALFTLPFFSGAVFAEEAVVYEEGEYKLPFEVKHGTEDKVSAADGYLTKPAKLTVKDGNNYIQMEITNSSMIKSLTVPSGEVDLISEDVGKDTRIVGFKTDKNLSEPLVMKMHVVVPGIYEANHTARAFFDVSGVPVYEEKPVEEPTKPEEKPTAPAEPEEKPTVPTEPTKPEEKPTVPTEPTKPEEKPAVPTEPEKPEEKPEEKPTAPTKPVETDGDKVENKNPALAPDKAFTINYVSESSSVNRQFKNPATLLYKDGVKYIQITGTGGQYFDSLTVNGEEVTWGEINADGAFTVQFKIENSPSKVLNLAMIINTGRNIMEHKDIGLSFDESTKKAADINSYTLLSVNNDSEEEVEVPAEPIKPAKPSKPEQPIVNDGDKNKDKNSAQTPDKAYKINFVSKSGSVNKQFNNPAVLLYKNGEKYIQMTGTGGQYIESLTINGTEVTWGKKNADGTFTFEFKVDGSLSDVLNFGMRINTGFSIMEHEDIDLSFDESTQKAANIKDYTLLTVINDPKEEGKVPPKAEKPSKGEEVVNKEKPADKDPKTQNTPAKKDQLVPDKAYKIGFVIKHETEDKPSAADSFFKGPAILLYKNGEKYIQVTVTNSQFIDSLTTKHGDMVLVKDNGDGSMVVQFKVDGKISDVIDLNMIITVPGVYEGAKHIARLFLDESSMKEIDASDYLLAASSNGNGPSAEGEPDKDIPLPGAKDNTPKTNNNDTNNNKNTKNDPTIEKPKFGSNGANKSIIETVIAGKEKNPQTGDTTNILLYVLLLIGSAIPLAVMAKRRFAKVA